MSKKTQPALDAGANRIVVFQEKNIRRTWHQNQWWFSVLDVVAALSGSTNPADYIKKMRLRDKELSQGWGQFVTPLRLETEGGIQRVNCATTEGIFRIVQSIASPRAEPFKRWLAQVGYERVQEIEDPELASARARELYEAKGYSKDWIEKRMRSIAIRGALTQEWKQRGVSEGREYSILTAEIARATFGLTPGAHKKFKGLEQAKTANLRDHMTDLELIFTMLGEASTTELAKKKDAKGFRQNQQAARDGGEVAGNARKELEGKSGTPVVSAKNYLIPKTPVSTKSVGSTELAAKVFSTTQAEEKLRRGLVRGKPQANQTHEKKGKKK
jgi:DNA-damage-inducible protein D